MPQFGADRSSLMQSIAGISDDVGNPIVSSSTDFASSPLGVAARTQAFFGIANAQFNLTPPNPESPIVDNANPLPYWTCTNASDGQMTAKTVFDVTTGTWGLEMNPGTAAINSTLSLTTRSYVLTDDNLALRQRALAVLSKSGTAGGTASQWNLQLSAIYYDANDTALSTAVIGTALDTATWTSFAGTTTPGGSAINAAAQYVDLTFTMTATAAVTGSAKATIKSLILATSTPTTGSFLVTETFTSSGTWTRPTGVTNLVAVVAIGAGGGGAGGGARVSTLNADTNSGAGGGGGRWSIIRDVYVGDVGSVSVGIGAGGAGGTSYTVAYTGALTNGTGGTGSNGGATTFGSYLSVPGGGGAGTSNTTGVAGLAGGTITTTVYDNAQTTAGSGAVGSATNAGTSGAQAFVQMSFTPPSTGGTTSLAGSYALTFSSGSVTGTTTNTPTGAGGSSFSGGGGAGDYFNELATFGYRRGGTATAGGGGGGVGYILTFGTASSGSVYASDGAVGKFGGGGGGGGALLARTNTNSRFTLVGSKGGAGSDGLVYVVYVA